MKRLLIACACVLMATAAWAKVEPGTEVTGSASYVKPDGGHSSWAMGGELAFPITKGGHVLIGPAVQIINAEEDFQAFGAVLELNLTGAQGLFIGGAGLYDADAPDGADDYTVDARAGLKFVVAGGGLFKVYVNKTVDGYGKSEDLRGVAAFGCRF